MTAVGVLVGVLVAAGVLVGVLVTIGVLLGVGVLVAVAVLVGALVGPPLLQGFNAVEVLRGVGVPLAKFTALLSVSVQPAPARRSAVVLVSAGAGLPSKQLAPP